MVKKSLGLAKKIIKFSSQSSKVVEISFSKSTNGLLLTPEIVVEFSSIMVHD